MIASFAFSGADRFEMEDQRQWLDASFKTYCRPLRQPWSVLMPPPPPPKSPHYHQPSRPDACGSVVLGWLVLILLFSMLGMYHHVQAQYTREGRPG